MRGRFARLTIYCDLFYSVNGMFDESSDLSPDLEWMLQSRQVDDDTLIEALAHQYYQPIYGLALSWLTYPEEAHRAAQETIVEAVFQARKYRGETKIDDWLLNILSEICYQCKLSFEVHRFLNPKLIRSSRSRQSKEVLTPHQIEQAIHKIKTQVRTKHAAKTKRLVYQVLGLSIVVFFAVFLIVRMSSSWFPGTPAEKTASPLPPSIKEITPQIEETSLFITDPRVRLKPIVPLSLNSDQEEIQDRLLYSSQLWDTLWVDVVVTFYGPNGYIGPPYSERHQFWIDQDRGGLLVSGPMQGFPDYIDKILLTPERSSMNRRLFNVTGFSKVGSQYPWFSIKTDTVFKYPFAINYYFKSINQGLQQVFTYSPVGEEVWAGRDAVIVDLISQDGRLHATFWLDSLTGIILREQYYDPDSTGKGAIESHVSEIVFDNPMPTMWKRPDPLLLSQRLSFMGIDLQWENYGIGLELSPKNKFPGMLASPNIDASQSKITFFKADRFDYNSEGLGVFHLFADHNFIGDIELVDPLRMICARSPDGRYIVFSEWSLFPTDINNKIFSVDLNKLNLVRLSIPDTIILRISVSPDNRRFIVSGQDGIDGWGYRFYLVDSDFGDHKLLPIPAGFGSIAWSPDGNQVAIIDRSIFPYGPDTSSTILVYDLESEEKKYERQTDNIPPGSTTVTIPLEGWTAKFNLGLQDLTNCTAPT